MPKRYSKHIIYIFISALFFSIQIKEVAAQKCSKKKLADKDIRLDFDYRGQSLFVELSNGDTTSLNIILYSKQNYRIFVAGEQKLGNIEYQIIVPKKKFNRVMESVQPKTVNVYKKDPNGFYLYNPEGERIVIGEETIMDTTWTRETTVFKEVVFDSNKAENNFWEATPSKTQLITIKVNVGLSEKKQLGCVGLYVGREYSNIYQFRR
ncbi:MAG: hypothetical protein JEZ09_09765 [Salinivirgaceae bacterium]|nr:hypothetical protein [Salinivirgaceae bacterium]